jgi:diguanylate cyclase (GGDEF)-like protein
LPPRMPFSPGWAEDRADAGLPLTRYRLSLRVPLSSGVPITRSATLALFRQNRVRGLVAAIVAAALIVWPRVESRAALFGALAGLTVYVAWIGASTFWMARRQRAGIALMSAHGIADVFLLFAVVRPLAGAANGGWILLAAAVPLQMALVFFGTRPAALVFAATLCAHVVVVATSGTAVLNGTAGELWALGSYGVLAAVTFVLHGRVERRLRVLAALFDEAREGDFRRSYDVAGDPHADAVTAIGAAFNELRAELAPMIHADPATGCLNRRGFALQLDRALAEARRRRGDVALLAVDLDHFKQINDRFGHLVGDEVLYEVATMLAEAVSEEGVVARMGGEEFTVLLPWADAEAAGAVAERMMNQLQQRSCASLPAGTPVTMSIGIASERITDSDVGLALRARADEALYAAKRSGRNRVRLWAPGVRSNATPATSTAAIVRRSGEVQRPRYRTPPDPAAPVGC